MDWSKVPIPQSYDDLYRLYGDPRRTGFEEEYIISSPHFLSNGNAITIRHHKAILLPLHNAFLNARQYIHTYDGCFVVRDVRGETTPSIHSWGLAIDINAAAFPLGSTLQQDVNLTNAFASAGFFWGGHYHHRKDPMHYQYAGDF